MRDLWRRGSGMTLRRLAVLIFNLPADSATWRSYATEQEKALKPKVEQIRDRQAHYDRQAKAAAKVERATRVQHLEHELSIAGHEPECPECQRQKEAP